MNGLLFGCAAGLMLGGSMYLLMGRRRIDRSLACVAVAGGIGVLAAGAGAPVVLGVDLLLIAGLLIAAFRAGRSDSALNASDNADETVDSTTCRSGTGSPLRKALASLISAAIGGVLLSVIWSNPIWKVKAPAGQEYAPPGIGIVLIVVVILLLLSFAFMSEHGKGGAARTSRETET